MCVCVCVCVAVSVARRLCAPFLVFPLHCPLPVPPDPRLFLTHSPHSFLSLCFISHAPAHAPRTPRARPIHAAASPARQVIRGDAKDSFLANASFYPGPDHCGGRLCHTDVSGSFNPVKPYAASDSFNKRFAGVVNQTNQNLVLKLAAADDATHPNCWTFVRVDGTTETELYYHPSPVAGEGDVGNGNEQPEKYGWLLMNATVTEVGPGGRWMNVTKDVATDLFVSPMLMPDNHHMPDGMPPELPWILVGVGGAAILGCIVGTLSAARRSKRGW